MNKMVLFISTGRCGTQWLARNLADLYPAEAEVTHEPLGPHYRPRYHFREYDATDRQLMHEPIREHLERIRGVLDEKSYIETGWPAFSAAPLFLERFAPNVKLVHLVRHPVPASISHMVHQHYFGSPRRDDYTRHATLDPSLPGSFQRELRAEWPGMGPFEKCLFWWTELNLFALELKARFPETPYLLVRAEEILGGEGSSASRLLEHLELPDGPELADRHRRVEDRWHHSTDESLEWRTVKAYPRALELVQLFGYRLEEIEERDITARYR